MLVENFIQKLSKPEEEDDQFNCIRRIEFEATKDTGVIAGLTVMKIIKEEGSEDLGTVIGVDLDEDLQSWTWLAENRPGGTEVQGEDAASQLQELLPTLAVGWVQEEGLCRADQSIPPAGVGRRACHIVYQDCNGRGGRVFWYSVPSP